MAGASGGSVAELAPPKLVCSHPRALHAWQVVPCGNCKSCRIARLRKVVLRADLERQMCDGACCATLTYSDEFVGDGQVRPAEWKRVKERLYCAYRRDTGVKLRFFGVGEYGEFYGRPHWHVIAFGLPLSVGEEYWTQAWTDPLTGSVMGRLTVKDADHAAIRYCARYCMKKMTREGDPWLAGRAPEFVVRPNRPGLGLGFADRLVQSILEDPAALAAVKAAGDIPASLRLGAGASGMDKLLKQKVRVGVFGEAQAELVREARKLVYLEQCAAGLSRYRDAWASGDPASDGGRVAQRERRAEIFGARKSL